MWEHKFVCSECTRVCVECGIAFPSFITTDVKRYTDNQPLWVGYNKSNRFRNMILALFKPLTHSHIPGKMIKHLQKFPKFKSVKGIFECMKTAVCCRDKKYNCMHLYAVMFCKNYQLLRPPLPKMISDLIGDFIVLEAGHNNEFPKKRFFSYRWILVRLLKKYKLFRWVKYVKKLKNKSSCKRYTKMFETIMNLNTRAPTLDKGQVTGKLLLPLPGGGFQFRSPGSSESDPLRFVVPRETMAGSCPTRYDFPDNSCRTEDHGVSLCSTLRKLYASYIQQESHLDKGQDFDQPGPASGQPVQTLV